MLCCMVPASSGSLHEKTLPAYLPSRPDGTVLDQRFVGRLNPLAFAPERPGFTQFVDGALHVSGIQKKAEVVVGSMVKRGLSTCPEVGWAEPAVVSGENGASWTPIPIQAGQ